MDEEAFAEQIAVLDKEEAVLDDKIKALDNPINEYINENPDGESTFQDLFEATNDNVDLRTDLTIQEIVVVNKIKVVDKFIKEKISSFVYNDFLHYYLRFKISLDRKSRGEFVDINRKERFEQNLQRFGNFSALSKVKE